MKTDDTATAAVRAFANAWRDGDATDKRTVTYHALGRDSTPATLTEPQLRAVLDENERLLDRAQTAEVETRHLRKNIMRLQRERKDAAAENERLRATTFEPHQGLTEDADVQLMSESLGVPVRIMVGNGRPVDGGINAGLSFDSIQWGRDKRIARVTISVAFPDSVIGPTPELDARMRELRAELDAEEAEGA